MKFEIQLLDNPAFCGSLLPLMEDFLKRTKLRGFNGTAVDAINYLAKMLISGAPIAIYVAVAENGELAAFAVLTVGEFPPRVWVEMFHQKREYARYHPAELLWEKVCADLKERGIKEIYAMVGSTSRVRLFLKKAGFVPAEIVLRKVI